MSGLKGVLLTVGKVFLVAILVTVSFMGLGIYGLSIWLILVALSLFDPIQEKWTQQIVTRYTFPGEQI